MQKVLTPKERMILIRKGNEYFNKGNIEKAAKIFVTTAYKDGLIRIGDHYYFDKKNPLKALYFYIEANYRKRIDEVTEKISNIIKRWLNEDNYEKSSKNYKASIDSKKEKLKR